MRYSNLEKETIPTKQRHEMRRDTMASSRCPPPGTSPAIQTKRSCLSPVHKDRREVSFYPEVDVITIETAYEMVLSAYTFEGVAILSSDQVYNMLWWNPQAYYQFSREARTEREREDYQRSRLNMRGRDRRRTMKERREAANEAVLSVLFEQSYLQSTEEDDPDLLAEIYSLNSETSRKEALLNGLRNAQSVLDTNEETKTRLRSQQHGHQHYRQHQECRDEGTSQIFAGYRHRRLQQERQIRAKLISLGCEASSLMSSAVGI